MTDQQDFCEVRIDQFLLLSIAHMSLRTNWLEQTDQLGPKQARRISRVGGVLLTAIEDQTWKQNALRFLLEERNGTTFNVKIPADVAEDYLQTLKEVQASPPEANSRPNARSSH